MSEAIGTGIGWSAQADAGHAGKEAAEMARAALPPRSPQLALVFGSSWFDQSSLLGGVHSVLGRTPLIGGSTAGEITPEGPSSHSCVILLLGSETLQWSVGIGEGVDGAPREGGQQAAYQAMQHFSGQQRIGFLLFGDGLASRYADVVRGIQEVLGTSSLVVGGLAGDDLRFSQTYQYCNDRVASGAVVGVLLGGTGKIGVGIEHGFAPISKPRRITRAHANVLHELDGQPATSVYEEYFGRDLMTQMQQTGFTRQRIAYPLGMRGETTDQWLLRNVVAFKEDGSLSCSGELLEGAWLQLMIGSRELALEAARQAAQDAIRSLREVAAVLVFDSVARRTLLGERCAAEEVACIRHIIGPSVPLIGCYTYGEQAPLRTSAIAGRTAIQTGAVLVVAVGT